MAGHSVKVDRPGIDTYDLLNFAQPKPNRKFLGLFRLGVLVYDLNSGGKDRKFKRWMRNNLGRAPVLLDSALIDNSLIPMRVYLNNKGYFGAEVQRRIELRGARAFVNYQTKTKDPFIFGQVVFDIPDDSLRYFLNTEGTASLITSGKQYDAYLMRDERERITRVLKDAGYYAFSREYIFFEVDTTRAKGKADIKVRVENVRTKPSGLMDSASFRPHQRYFISNIFVNTNFAEMVGDSLPKNDTLAYRKNNDSLLQPNPDFYLIYKNRLRIRPAALSRAVFIQPGTPFNQQKINLTYNRLQNLGLSRFVSVNLNPAEIAPELQPEGISLLDCDIRMVRNPVNMINPEVEATNAGGFVGLGGSLNYRNRNIFRGAETFRLKLRGAFEVEPDLGLGIEPRAGIFNSLEAGVETGLDFPTLLSPFRIEGINRNYRAKTTVALGLNYQQRSYYTRYVSYASFGYDWYSSNTTRHLFSPVELSSVSIVRDSTFNAILKDFKDPRYLNQYTDHLVMALKYSFIFNNQNLSSKKNYFYFRANFESAGNLLNLYSNIANAPVDEDGNFTLFRIRFAQYIRTDFDFRYYKPLTAKQQLVYRAALGVGVPYGNSSVLPFEKGFFAGGANGLRGWPIRSVGPGEYYTPVKSGFERVGDIWLEANLEYRFPMYSFLNGAFFIDAGNIWLLRENEDFPGGKLDLKKLPASLALDTGLGLRFDFSFFIFRIDGGLPVYDPGKLTDSRWFSISKFQLRDITWNFGIGYPF
ncbi:BamA/TamA family outer membrane protein [Lentimicrobium sp.]|uniref:translocation and assembly module lipoprotein TamL n=1 Tax=Lentimicrobium sp. TaxID=2034841 RepID=UPI00345EC4BC